MARLSMPVARRGLALAALFAAGLGLAACGSSSHDSSTTAASSSSSSPPTVLAAASLSKVFPQIDPSARYTFGGSGALEADIEQSAPADVFAAASPKQPAQLFARGLVDKPVEFATNTLVMVVPAANPAHVRTVTDITRPGVKLVICDATVPCGDYARTVFKHLGITRAAMRNVVSEATDVTQTLADVALGQADAGFVYITDAKAAAGKVRVIRLPAAAKPKAEDYIAVVKAAKNQAAAKAFVAQMLSASGQAKLRAAGFGTP